jgi:hypothetical protein
MTEDIYISYIANSELFTWVWWNSESSDFLLKMQANVKGIVQHVRVFGQIYNNQP